jgi:hypothetical protein
MGQKGFLSIMILAGGVGSLLAAGVLMLVLLNRSGELGGEKSAADASSKEFSKELKVASGSGDRSVSTPPFGAKQASSSGGIKVLEELSIPWDWKSYESRVYNFSVKHPNYLLVEEFNLESLMAQFKPHEFRFTFGENKLSLMSFWVIETDHPLEESIKENYCKGVDCDFIEKSAEKILISGAPGYKFSLPGSSKINYAFKKDNKFYYAIYTYGYKAEDNPPFGVGNEAKIFEQVVSSFKFLD